MKLILVATASLMTAGAAFGFARLADRLTEPAPIAAPQPVAAERVLRQNDSPQATLPGPAPTGPSLAAAVADPPAPALTPAVTTTPPSSASRDRVATAVPSFQPAFQNMNHFTPPAAGPTLDLPAPARRYEFETLPVIGVYR